MHRLTLIIILSLIPAGFWGGPGTWPGLTPAAAAEDSPPLRKQVESLKGDISSINLLNALHLSREQLSQILKLAQEAKRVREGAFNSPQVISSLQNAAAAFQSLRSEIQQGSPARGEIPARAVQMEHRLKELKEQAIQQLQAQYQALEDRLRRVLSPEQLQVVQDFNPCLIPPLELRNPVRAGQAAVNEGAIKHLRRLRQLPEDKWQAQKQGIIRGMVEKFSKNRYRLSEAEKRQEQARLLEWAEKVRRMPEMDFELNKEKLVESFRPPDRLKELRAELERRSPHVRQANLSKVGRFLLSERLIPILEERLQGSGLAAAN